MIAHRIFAFAGIKVGKERLAGDAFGHSDFAIAVIRDLVGLEDDTTVELRPDLLVTVGHVGIPQFEVPAVVVLPVGLQIDQQVQPAMDIEGMVDIEIYVNIQKTAVRSLVQASPHVVIGDEHVLDARHSRHPTRHFFRKQRLLEAGKSRVKLVKVRTFRFFFVDAFPMGLQVVHRRKVCMQFLRKSLVQKLVHDQVTVGLGLVKFGSKAAQRTFFEQVRSNDRHGQYRFGVGNNLPCKGTQCIPITHLGRVTKRIKCRKSSFFSENWRKNHFLGRTESFTSAADMRIFVTGGSGYLGQHLLKRLQQEGHQLTVLCRSDDSERLVRRLGDIAIVRGDLANMAQWEACLQDQHVVIHAAAPVEFWGHWEKFYREITLATKELLAAASRWQVARFIFISSESVLQSDAPLTDIDESFPYPDEPNSYYGRAKKWAEQEVLRMETPVHRIILRPSFVWGPGVKAVETMIEKVLRGEFLWVDQGENLIEMVHVHNAVHGILCALTQGQNKGIYFLTDGQAQPVRTFVSKLLASRHVHAPDRSLSGRVVWPLAWVVESVWRILALSSTPPISRFEVSFVATPRRYKTDKSRDELGYRPVIGQEEAFAAYHAANA